jgi:hypothetical protein
MGINYNNAVVDVNIFRSAGYYRSRDFNTVVYMVDLASNNMAGITGETSIGTNDSVYAVISSPGELTLANQATTGSFSAGTIAAVTAYFQQVARPKRIYIVAVDIVGGDSFASILPTIYQNIPFMWLCCNTRTAATIVAIANAQAAMYEKTIYVAQSNSALIKGSAEDYADGAFGDAFTNKSYVFGLLAEDTMYHDMRYVGAISTVNLYVDCPPGDIPVVSPELVTYSTTEIANSATNYWNVNAPLGNLNTTRPGWTLDGKAIYIMISEIFAKAIVQEKYIQLKNTLGLRKQKLRMDAKGMATANTPGKEALQMLEGANHIKEDYVCEVQEITEDDETSQNIRVNLTFSILKSATTVSVNVYMEI